MREGLKTFGKNSPFFPIKLVFVFGFYIAISYFPASAFAVHLPENAGSTMQGIRKGAHKSKAHKSNHAQQKAQVEAERLKHALGLSQEQFSKIFNIAVERERDLDYVKKRKDLDKSARKVQADTLWAKYDTKLQNILTPEQLAVYQQAK